MITFVAVLLSLGLQAAPVVSLPATPQGKQLEAFVKAFRTSEAAFVAYQGENMLPKRTRSNTGRCTRACARILATSLS